MKTFIFGTLLTILLTIASGILQGSLSNRWGPSDLQRQAGAKIQTLPEKFAAWEMQKSEKLEKDAFNQLQPAGYIQRIYVNRDSGASVNVTVLLGPSGPIAVHTPEVCYGGRDHQQIGERQSISIPAKDGKDSLWKTTFRLKGIDATMQNVYYAWSPGDHWVAAENPRISYATSPFLYKIQLASSVPVEKFDKSDPSTDPGIRFLTDFLPVLQNYMRNPASK